MVAVTGGKPRGQRIYNAFTAYPRRAQLFFIKNSFSDTPSSSTRIDGISVSETYPIPTRQAKRRIGALQRVSFISSSFFGYNWSGEHKKMISSRSQPFTIRCQGWSCRQEVTGRSGREEKTKKVKDGRPIMVYAIHSIAGQNVRY